MKKFLRFTVKILLILILYGIAICTFNSFLFRYNHKKSYAKNYKTLVIGDSKMRDINEKIIANSINLFQDGDTYEVMYYKVRELLKYNNPENLILAYSYNNISPLSEERIWNTEGMLKRIYALTSLRELNFFYNDNFKGSLAVTAKNLFSINWRYLVNTLKGNIRRYNTFDTNVRYQPIEKIKNSKKKNWFSNQDGRLRSIEKMITHQYKANSYSLVHSESSVYFLEKIISLCTEEQVRIFLVTMPLDAQFRNQIPGSTKLKFEEIKKSLLTSNNIDHIDLESEYDNRFEMMKNQNHVTSLGAAEISEKLNNLVNQRK